MTKQIHILQDIERKGVGVFTVHIAVIDDVGKQSFRKYDYAKAGSVFAGYKSLITELNKLNECEVIIETTHKALADELRDIHNQTAVLAKMLRRTIYQNKITIESVILRPFKNR